MQLCVNGEKRSVREGLTALGLLEELGLRREAVVVERNEEVVPRGRLAEIELADGDQIEIIRMIAGG